MISNKELTRSAPLSPPYCLLNLSRSWIAKFPASMISSAQCGLLALPNKGRSSSNSPSAAALLSNSLYSDSFFARGCFLDPALEFSLWVQPITKLVELGRQDCAAKHGGGDVKPV